MSVTSTYSATISDPTKQFLKMFLLYLWLCLYSYFLIYIFVFQLANALSILLYLLKGILCEYIYLPFWPFL